MRSEGEEAEGEGDENNEGTGGGVMSDVTEKASATIQGITNIITSLTPRRQRTTEPRRNIESEISTASNVSGTRQISNGEENANNSGNERRRAGVGRD